VFVVVLSNAVPCAKVWLAAMARNKPTTKAAFI